MLTKPQLLFGIHSVTPYDIETRKPISFLRVLGEASLDLKGEFEELKGGSSMFPFDAEPSNIGTDCSFTAREYPISMMEKLLAGVKTDFAADAAGQVIDLANVKGTSVISAGGLASVTVKAAEKTDLKTGEYVIEALDANSLALYALSDIGLGDGTKKEILDDTMKVVASVDITAATGTDVDDFGLTLTGGAGPIAFAPGDTARFRIIRPSVSGVKLIVGQAGSTFSEFGCIISGQRKSDGAMAWLDIYRCRAAGMPISFKEKGYSEWNITLKVLYDSAKNGVFEYIRIG